MKICIKNKSDKKRSLKIKNELKLFALQMATEFGINNKIKVITLEFKNDFNGYYPKHKPLGGFIFLLKDGHVKITFARFWDINQKSRKEAIVHELTHAKQIINKELVIIKEKETIWNGKKYDKWKRFRFTKMESFKRKEQKREYLVSHFPWEKEVQANVKKYVNSSYLI